MFNLRLFFILSLLFTLNSCAGYRFKNQENPFASYGIRSVAIPMFYNRTALPAVSGPFTSEVRLLMSSFSGLEVHPSYRASSDAILIGIVESPDSIRGTLESSSFRLTSDEVSESISSRPDFYVAGRSRVRLSLRVILIHRPSKDDLELIHSEQWSPFLSHHPRVIFDHRMSLSEQFSRVIDDSLSLDHGGVVNFTKNHHQMTMSVEKMAKSARENFRELVLNVF